MRYATSFLFFLAILLLSLTQSCTPPCGDDDFAGEDDDSSAGDDDVTPEDDDATDDDDGSGTPALELRFEMLWQIGPPPIPIHPCDEDLPLITFVAESRDGSPILVMRFGFLMRARTVEGNFNTSPPASQATSARFGCELWHFNPLVIGDSFLIGSERSSDSETSAMEFEEDFSISSEALFLTLVCNVSCNPIEVGDLTDFSMDILPTAIQAETSDGQAVEILIQNVNHWNIPEDPDLWYRLTP